MSLGQAIQALAGLSQGNRLVGIISHVGDLKEKIDKQIVVTKAGCGGSILNILEMPQFNHQAAVTRGVRSEREDR